VIHFFFHGPERTDYDKTLSFERSSPKSRIEMSPVSSKSSQVVSTLKRKRDASPDSIDASSSSSELGRTEDAPVLSHAARRKQKKKASLNEAAPTSLPSRNQKKEDDAFHPVKRQNSIWVGNLCYKTTPESLRRFFNEVGEITRVHLPTKLGKASPGELATRENRGYDFNITRISWSSCFAYPV